MNDQNFRCYLCKSDKYIQKKGTVRDKPDLKILECKNCKLVTLNSFDHIKKNYYENSKMNSKNTSLEDWKSDSYIDDSRRIKNFRRLLFNRILLDFGCGAGGFLQLSKPITKRSYGFELDNSVIKYWKNKLKIYNNLNDVKLKFDIITMFHVLEHLKDPIKTLTGLKKILKPNGIIIMEVPNSNDALINLYDSSSFQKFTYWSNHLFLYNSDNLAKIISKAGYKVQYIRNYQRYPISNHLYWLSKNKPGGHKIWDFFNDKIINRKYSDILCKRNFGDTLIAKISNV